MYKNSPISAFFSMAVPTVPIIKSGPELLQKGRRRIASVRLINFFSYRSRQIFAPAGYPLKMPVIKQSAPPPLTLKSGSIKGEAKFSIKSANPQEIKVEEKTKKGKSEGITAEKQRDKAFFAAETEPPEKKTVKIINKIKIT